MMHTPLFFYFYYLAIAIFISASVSVISSPDTSSMKRLILWAMRINRCTTITGHCGRASPTDTAFSAPN